MSQATALGARMCPGTFSRLRRSLATSTLYAAVCILAVRFVVYRKAISCTAPTVKAQLAAVQAGEFEGGVIDTLGLISENPEENFVQLPSTTLFAAGFTAEDYAALVKAMFNGEITVSNDITAAAADFATVITVTDLGNLK